MPCRNKRGVNRPLALEVLDLSQNPIGDNALSDMLNALGSDTSLRLRELHLHYTGATRDMVRSLGLVWNGDDWGSSLKTLALSGLRLDKPGSSYLAPAMVRASGILSLSIVDAQLHTKTLFKALVSASESNSLNLYVPDYYYLRKTMKTHI